MSLEEPQDIDQQVPSQQIPAEEVLEIPATQEEVERIALQFNPRVEVDNEGLTRNIFEYQGKTFSFQGRDETPDYPTIEKSSPTFLGHESMWLMHPSKQKAPALDKDSWPLFKASGWTEEQLLAKHDEEVAEWQAKRDGLIGFKDRIKKLQETQPDQPEHFLVEQSPLGIYALMERLQPKNPLWQQERESIEKGHYSEAALQLIDMITGVNALSVDNNGDDSDAHPPLGEAIIVAALLGDEQAQQLALTAAQQQTDRETAKRQEIGTSTKAWLQRPEVQKVEAFKPEDLVVVHATGHKPDFQDGSYIVQTTFDATGFPRSTIHTAINHKVENNLFGDWDSQDYVLIAGLDKMLDINGDPNSSNGADTWWTRNPGEKLQFPEATLVAPGGAQTELVVREAGQVRYKSEGITASDLLSLSNEAQERIKQSLASDGTVIDLTSPEGQRIAANVIRDEMVRDEVVRVRGKAWLDQSDDKFMPIDIGVRLEKMYAERGGGSLAGLHNGGSNEGVVEKVVGSGDRTQFLAGYDPKVRRVAYASGLMNGGGEDRKNYLERQIWNDQPVL